MKEKREKVVEMANSLSCKEVAEYIDDEHNASVDYGKKGLKMSSDESEHLDFWYKVKAEQIKMGKCQK